MGEEASDGESATWGAASLRRAEGGGVLAGEDFWGEMDLARSVRAQNQQIVRFRVWLSASTTRPKKQRRAARARARASALGSALSDVGQEPMRRQAGMSLCTRSSYLRVGPGVLFAAAAASPLALWSGRRRRRHVAGSIALLTAGSWSPRRTWLGKTRRRRWWWQYGR